MNASLSAHPVFDAGILEGLHLLEADAGTGKTWTIAGLVVRALIERELGIEQLLVVTFTNAATAELGARIRQRIAQLERLLDDRIEARATAVDEPFCVAFAAGLDDTAALRARSALRIALARVDEMAVHTI
ncbi:MAG: UvrD-helicase domain-containing protein, partial [Burkholderiaceae bacterium]|nr:UvrD-helicase domain-containing protein [Burkholderiaceae bacterium]